MIDPNTSTWRWATVESRGPLRIRLDGETTAVPADPETLVDPAMLIVGQRVRVQQYQRRMIIIGASHGVRYGSDMQRAAHLMPRFTGSLMDQANRPAKIVWFGDSISEGWFSDTPTANRRAIGLVQDRLRKNPSRARGWLPAVYTQNGLPIEGTMSSTPGAGADITVDEQHGLGMKALSLSNSAWREWTFVGTSVRVWWWQHNFFAANAKVTIDGGEPTYISGAGPSDPVPTSQFFSGLTAGTHTVRVTVDGPSGFIFLLEAIETFDADSGGGVHLYDGTHFGWTTLNFILPNVRWKKTLAAIAPQTVIVATGANDSIAYDSETFGEYLTTFMFHILDALGPNHDYAIVSMPKRRDFPTVSPWSEYVAKANAIAQDFGRGIHIDVGGWWRPELTSSDGVHTTPEGQRIIAAAVASELGG